MNKKPIVSSVICYRDRNKAQTSRPVVNIAAIAIAVLEFPEDANMEPEKKKQLMESMYIKLVAFYPTGEIVIPPAPVKYGTEVGCWCWPEDEIKPKSKIITS